MTSLYERDASVSPAEIAPYRSTKARQVGPAALTVDTRPAPVVAAIAPVIVRDGISYNELIVTASISVVAPQDDVAAGE